MVVKYAFADGEKSEVEVDEDIGNFITESRRMEESGDRKERRHCYSMDAAVYEGAEYGCADFTEEMFDEEDERNTHVHEAFSHLSKIQQNRLLMLASGLSIREIARREGRDYRTVYESIEAAKKKFQKYF